MSLLLSPVKFKDVQFRNRIAISTMCMYSSVDGYANDLHMVHLGSGNAVDLRAIKSGMGSLGHAGYGIVNESDRH
jgi:2,4-dienoyl-CoA reductase-like NADH-dependent reductase (Old Yellow Enzyme family)